MSDAKDIKARIKTLTEVGVYDDPEELIAAVILLVGDQIVKSIEAITADNIHEALCRIGDKLDAISERMP